MNRVRAVRNAKWGAACAPCAAAKTRCIRTQPSGSQQCDRCRGLGKDCVSQNPGPRKKRQAKSFAHFNLTRARGEEELNNLASSSTTPVERHSLVALESLPHDGIDHIENVDSASSVSAVPQAQATPSQADTAPNTSVQDFTVNRKTGAECTCMETLNIHDSIPVESDETLLSIYRNQLSPSLPFVVIPAGITSAQLQATHPFLMKVIRMVASVRHLRLIRGQSRAIMEHISTAILIESESSLDLLQGILVILGFYHYHCMAHAQFNNLIRLAVSLVEDLGLNSCPKSRQSRNQLPLARAEEPIYRTNDEKRALLGVGYISSSAGLIVKQMARAIYTKYMDECLKELFDAGEYKTDQLIVELVRIQRLTERISHFHSDDSPMEESLGSPEPSKMARIETFQVELDDLRNAIIPSLKRNYFLSYYHHSAALRIFEPLLAGSHLPDADPQSFASLSLLGVSIIDVFSRFSAALKAWIDHWLNIPVCSYFYMPQPAYMQLVHGAMMLTRWVRVAGPSAVRHFNAGAAMSQKVSAIPLQPMPALSGIPPCPDLSLPRPLNSQVTQVVSAQMLNTLRAKIAAQSNMQIDILGVLDIMAARFETAKKEMTAAQGLEWENDIWDYAAEHLKMKKSKVERWCDTVAVAAGEGRSSPADFTTGISEESTGTTDLLQDQGIDGFEWGNSEYDWVNMQWESVLFDEILQDIHN